MVHQISNRFATEYAIRALRFLNFFPTGNEAIAVYILIDGSEHNVVAILS